IVNLCAEWIVVEGQNNFPSVNCQNIYLRPPKYPIRGPNCGANTPIPVPVLISLTLSKALIMATRASTGPQFHNLNLRFAPKLSWTLYGTTCVLANPARKPLPYVASALNSVSHQR